MLFEPNSIISIIVWNTEHNVDNPSFSVILDWYFVDFSRHVSSCECGELSNYMIVRRDYYLQGDNLVYSVSS